MGRGHFARRTGGSSGQHRFDPVEDARGNRSLLLQWHLLETVATDERHGVRRDIEPRPWRRNVVRDNQIHALPLQLLARARHDLTRFGRKADQQWGTGRASRRQLAKVAKNVLRSGEREHQRRILLGDLLASRVPRSCNPQRRRPSR